MQQRHRCPAKESSGEQPENAAAEEACQRAQPRPALGFGEEQNDAVSGAALAACSRGVSPFFARRKQPGGQLFPGPHSASIQPFCHIPWEADKAGGERQQTKESCEGVRGRRGM